jgi:glycerophosphoryl diester phosphodiesterase
MRQFLPRALEAGGTHVRGHRGHSIGAPENTLPALEAAAALGATCREVDLLLTRDERIVLRHDELLGRSDDGSGRVGEATLAELRRLDAGSWFDPHFAGTPIATLEDALETAARVGLGLLLEIKEHERTDALIDRLGESPLAAGALDHVLVISFDHPSLLRARSRIPGLRTELVTHARHVDPVALAERAAAASVAIEGDMFAPEDAASLHAAGVAVRVTIPRPAVIERRRLHGLDLEARLAPALAEGLIDILAGDDAAFVRDWVERHGRCAPRLKPTA